MVKALFGKKPEGPLDANWKQLEAQTVGTIWLFLADEITYHVMDVESSTEVWEKLESRYMSKSLTNKLHLKQRLYRHKVLEGTDLIQHTNVFNQIIDDLLQLEIKFDHEEKAMILLCSFRSFYDHLVTTLT